MNDDYLLAFDPGGVHVGVSDWRRGPGGWRPVTSAERPPTAVIDRLIQWLEHPTRETLPARVAYETFRLRGGRMALAQTGSTFPEVELIGVLRAVTRHAGIELVPVEPGARAAALKRAAALGYRWAAHGHGGHAKDAEAVAIAALDLGAAEIRALGVRV